MIFHLKILLLYFVDTMSVPTEFHSILSRTYHTLSISVRQPITEVKAEWNIAADVWEIDVCGNRNSSPVYIHSRNSE